MKQFFKWTAITASAITGAALVYGWASSARRRLEHGLEHVERIATEAHNAVAHTERALDETAQSVREVRRTMA